MATRMILAFLLPGLAALGCADAPGWLPWSSGGGDCHVETVQLPPAWNCGDDALAQLAEDEAALSPPASDTPVAVAGTKLALVRHDACAESVASTRSTLQHYASSQLRAARFRLLNAECRTRTEYRRTGDCSGTVEDSASSPATPSPTDASGNLDFASDQGASQYSTTNNQVAGVDEADFVKNDAKFVYTLALASGAANQADARARGQAGPSAPRSALVIFDVWPPEQAHEASRVALEGTPHDLQLAGDRLLVYASIPNQDQQDSLRSDYYASQPYTTSCSYGYDCVPTGDGQRTLITLYDVSDRSAPAPLRRVELSGSYLGSRRIADVVYTLLTEPLHLPPGVLVSPPSAPATPEAALAAFASLEQQNAQLLDAASAESLLPSLSATGTAAAAGLPPGECGSVYEAPGAAVASSFLSLVSTSLADDGALRRSVLISPPGFSYASSQSLYVAVPQAAGVQEQSVIHKFTLDGLDTRYAASGIVEGHVLNQFSMDEQGGYLRIATSTSRPPDPLSHSTLSILGPGLNGLVSLGQVGNIAPSEDIRSVRFAGDRGYVVTFKKTDPLFVFDLSDPQAPHAVGELKIPGFSTYLQPLDDGHLLSIGYDADDQGSFAWFQGVKLQLFDVSDMQSPRLLFKEVIGTRGSSSEALTNHLAFTYFAPKHWLALPITICEGGSGGTFGDQMTFSGLYLYDVSLDQGFDWLGGVEHAPSDGYVGYRGGACANWWTDASSEVKRSLIYDDYVLSLTSTELELNLASDLSHAVAVLPLRLGTAQ